MTGSAAGPPRYDDPSELAAIVMGRPQPLLLGLDVDGVLAPIVAHASDAQLLAGTPDLLQRIADPPGMCVAIVSGRSLDDLARFGFPDEIEQVGSHGMERAEHRITLEEEEARRLDHLRSMADEAARAAGDGAWVEDKPASVVLHVREADPRLATAAVDDLAEAVAEIHESTVMRGSGVLELFVRHGDKGTAVAELRDEVAAATTIFVGDDVTDERAFAALLPGDIGVKVGDADTVAHHRLRDPEAVQAFLAAIADAVTPSDAA
jgi:trehalose 6-phosphate phosphatase